MAGLLTISFFSLSFRYFFHSFSFLSFSFVPPFHFLSYWRGFTGLPPPWRESPSPSITQFKPLRLPNKTFAYRTPRCLQRQVLQVKKKLVSIKQQGQDKMKDGMHSDKLMFIAGCKRSEFERQHGGVAIFDTTLPLWHNGHGLLSIWKVVFDRRMVMFGPILDDR